MNTVLLRQAGVLTWASTAGEQKSILLRMATRTTNTTTGKRAKKRAKPGRAKSAWGDLSAAAKLTRLLELKETLAASGSTLKPLQIKTILSETAYKNYQEDCKSIKTSAAKGTTAKAYKRYENAKAALSAAVDEYLKSIDSVVTDEAAVSKKVAEEAAKGGKPSQLAKQVMPARFQDVVAYLKALSLPGIADEQRTVRDVQIELIQRMYTQSLESELHQLSTQLARKQ